MFQKKCCGTGFLTLQNNPLFYIFALYNKEIKMESQDTSESFGLTPENRTTLGEAVEPILDKSANVIICGGDNAVQTKEALEMAIMEAKLIGKTVLLVDDYKPSDGYNLKDIYGNEIPNIPYTLTRLPIPTIVDMDTPNKLQFLKGLNLTEEQIEFYKNSPPQRLENESSEDYKTRRMLNKLIVKYRGQF